jgi:1-acyl-sn-glycerol-3-phosphate acyltransferase
MEPVQETPQPSLLRNRNFVLLWAAYGVSATGDHLSEMALLKTQDALSPDVDITPLMARITFVFFVPFFMLAPFTGALADMFSRRALMVTADMVRFGIMIGFAALLGFTHEWGSWGAFAPLLLLGAFAAVFAPARSALLPTIMPAEQLIRANALLSGLGIIATMAATVVGGYLAQHYAPAVAFRADAMTFVLSGVLLLCMRLPQAATDPDRVRGLGPVASDLREGLRYVRAHRHVIELMGVAALIWFCGAVVNSVIPAVVRDVYQGNYQDISTYRALLGLGFIIGAVCMTVLGPALRGEVAITWGLAGVTLGVATFASSVFLNLSPRAGATLGGAAVVIAGIFAVAVMASFDALLQRTVANRLRGRVFGIRELVSTGALLVSTGLLGVPHWERLDRWVSWILLGVAGLTLGASVLTLLVRLRRGLFPPAINFASHLNEFVAKFWWRFRRIGPARVPRTGPVIIASNHICGADPVFISAAVPYRLVSFLIAAEYVGWPVVRWGVRILDCIPVRRGSRDAGSTKQALRHLDTGKAVCIFIEGGIIPPGRPRRPKDGVATLALRTGAPVFPAYISGITYREGIVAGLLTRHHARLQFGAPIDLTEFRQMPRNRDTVRAATRKIYSAILALAPEEEPPVQVAEDERVSESDEAVSESQDALEPAASARHAERSEASPVQGHARVGDSSLRSE